MHCPGGIWKAEVSDSLGSAYVSNFSTCPHSTGPLEQWLSSAIFPIFPFLQKAAEFILLLLSGTAVVLNVVNLNLSTRLGSR